jgi:triacylglycerol lipase
MRSKPGRLSSLAMADRAASQPVLKWLGSWSPYRTHSPHGSSGSPSPSSLPSANNTPPPSPGLASLDEALHEPLSLPRRPPPAKLSPASSTFFPRHAQPRPPPPFLDGLARSTLPTSSLAQAHSFLPPPSQMPVARTIPSPPIESAVSHPTHSSVDSLRRVSRMQTRASSTLASDASAQSKNSNWSWFSNSNKENVDGLLEEEDRADTVQEEREQIRKKCTFARVRTHT